MAHCGFHGAGRAGTGENNRDCCDLCGEKLEVGGGYEKSTMGSVKSTVITEHQLVVLEE